MVEHVAWSTHEKCFQCGGPLVQLKPPLEGGWEYYCEDCQSMVTTKSHFDWLITQPLEEGAIGHVVALPLKGVRIEPIEAGA